MPRRKETHPAQAFYVKLRIALEHFRDPTWLTKYSMLASPYFLGDIIRSQPNSLRTDNFRGQLLQNFIWEAAVSMWPGPLPSNQKSLLAAVEEERRQEGHSGPKYSFLLLELRYFRRFFPARTFPTTPAMIPDFLGVSSTRFYVHLNQALKTLSRLLLDRFQPALRLENPGKARELTGRQEIISTILNELPDHHSVAISGTGGVGKTSVGAAVARAWTEGDVLWFTFYPGLNDDLQSVIFAIAHFLNLNNASMLWLQLLANEGAVGPVEQALGFLRADLLELELRPLFCFDEVDLLQTSENEPRQLAHIQVLEFLENLRGLVSLLFIGQRSFIDTDRHIDLNPLTIEQAQNLLGTAGIGAQGQNLRRIHQLTEGNPRLLELCAALIINGETVDSLPQISGHSSVKPLFHRLWRRLERKEREILSLLSVLRNYAPPDSWLAHRHALDSLIDRGLVKFDLAGSVILLPFYRHMIYQDLLAEQRQQLHSQAAVLRAQLGEYTGAAYHYWKAEDYESAVNVWFPFQEEEIRRGQGGAALEVFKQISPGMLHGNRQRELRVIQTRLYLLAGEAERALEGLDSFAWQPDEELTAEAYARFGIAHSILGDYDAALQKHEQAIETLTRVAGKIAEQHFLRSQTFIIEADMTSLRRELALAQHDLDRMRGLIEYNTGNLRQAQTTLTGALESAAALGDSFRIAMTHQFLTMVAGRQGDTQRAERHAEKAITYFRETGNRLKAEGVRAEMAGIYLNTREFAKVIEPGEKALQFFEAIKHERWISALNNNLAEAYMELGELDKAKSCAFRVLSMENPRSFPYAHYTLGLLFEMENNLEQAESTLKRGITIAQSNEDKFIEAYLQRALGKFYVDRKNIAARDTHLKASIRLFEQMGLENEAALTREILCSSD